MQEKLEDSIVEPGPEDSSACERRVAGGRLAISTRLAASFNGSAAILLVTSLIAAPWMYGATRHWAIIRLCECLSLIAALWIAGLLVARRPPAVPVQVTVPVIFLLLSGWIVILTRPALLADETMTAHFAALYARWPGSIIVKTPAETMWLYSGLLTALAVTIDLSSRCLWRQTLAITIAGAGASIVVLGIAEIRSGATSIFWDSRAQLPGFFFGTFFHYSAAGAFINLTWPIAAGLLLCNLGNGRTMTPARMCEVAACGLLMAIGFCGICSQLSKFAQANAILLFALIAGWLLWRSPARRAACLIAGALLCCVLAFVICNARMNPAKTNQIEERWRSLLAPDVRSPAGIAVADGGNRMRPDLFIPSNNPIASQFMGDRRLADATCLRMIPEAGLFGFGPGTWTGTYYHFTTDPFLRTFFLYVQFAHQDYLQTIVEWGLLGAAAWGCIIFGGLKSGLSRLRRFRRECDQISREEGIVLGALIGVVGVLLHALLDFPLQIPSIQLYTCVLLGLLWRGKSEETLVYER